MNTNGIDSMAITKVDVLDQVETLKIATGYRSKGEEWDHPMSNISHLKHAEPVYEEMPGWLASTRDLPALRGSAGRLPALRRAPGRAGRGPGGRGLGGTGSRAHPGPAPDGLIGVPDAAYGEE